LGSSDPRPEEQPDSRNIAHHPHVLLANARVNPPYALVGYAIGGIQIRLYQNLYPAETRTPTLHRANIAHKTV
jgi:hypothetical protein